MTKKKLTRFEMGVFAAGDMFGGGSQLIISFYYLVFLTDVVKIRPSLAGMIILLSKIWDAISDPLMGNITDNTRTKFGRRKPYFLIGACALVLAFFLLWFPIKYENINIKFLFVLLSYLFYSTVSTIILVPYAAMSSEISQDYIKRNNVNGARMVFSQIASLLCAVLPLEIVRQFSNQRIGYMAMSLFFGCLFAIPFILMFFFTHERVPIPKERVAFKMRDFMAPLRVKSFRYLVCIYLFAFLAMDIVATVFPYYMNYYLELPTKLNYVLGALLITQIIMTPIIVATANRIGKSKVFRLATIVWILGNVALSFQRTSFPSWAIFLNAFIVGCGLVGCIVMPWTMYPDVCDVGELEAGKRNAGAYGGFMTFMRKLSSAVGIFIVSTMLEIAGYIEPTTQTINGQAISTLNIQPDSVIFALKIIVVVIPAILLLSANFIAKYYPISKEKHQKLLAYLQFKRNQRKKNPLSESEIENLKRELI